MKESKTESELSPELKKVVRWSVGLLGQVIRKELGEKAYQRIEKIRKDMVWIRKKKHDVAYSSLERTYQELRILSFKERMEFAKSYTLMLELMNACENAYRSHRLRGKKKQKFKKKIKRILFVLTAHPTESRSPDNIAVFHEIQKELTSVFNFGFEGREEKITSLLEIAWNTEIVRQRKPKVQDEAEHIYSILLRDSNLTTLLEIGKSECPVYIRSWVGGDKDGHPGVNSKALLESLQMSRNDLIQYAKKQINDLKKVLSGLTDQTLLKQLLLLSKNISDAKIIEKEDAKKIKKIHESMTRFFKLYEKFLGISKPTSFHLLEQLLIVFPGLVVPLELREDSATLMSDPSGKTLAIGKMLKKIGEISRGGDPCWYARGMIISMAENVQQIRVTGKMARKQVGNDKIPIVPLFEKKSALDSGSKVIAELLNDKKILKIVKEDWNGIVEVMVGYSDSSKEAGVLSSRLSIHQAIHEIDQECRKKGVTPVFFHGSGGSIDRGGGSVRDQLSGLPLSARSIYKATIQGEMVERTFSSPEILESQLRQIAENNLNHPPKKGSLSSSFQKSVERFSEKVMNSYQNKIRDPDFLRVVEVSTPYRYLAALKMGSRPTSRPGIFSVTSLRAIPWVLCWTQTRVLFPTWWGVGEAWESTNALDRKKLRQAFQLQPVFRTFVHALGFTLAKIELPVFEFYVQHSNIDKKLAEKTIQDFKIELKKSRKFLYEITHHQDPLWFRPWLSKSIRLRTTMIHPLNILQWIAQEKNEPALLRLSVTGIACGMLTTG